MQEHKNNNALIEAKNSALVARTSAMPTTLLERHMMTEQQAIIAAAKCGEYELTPTQARLAVVADALDDAKEESQKLVGGIVRQLRAIQKKQSEDGNEELTQEESSAMMENQDAIKSLPMRKVVAIILANPKATDEAQTLTKTLAVASTAIDVIAYAKLGMGMHIDDQHPNYKGMVAELETLLFNKYGGLSPKEVLQAMRDYNERTSSKRQLGQYTPFNLSVVYSALEEYTTKRNRFLAAAREEEQRQYKAAEEEKKENEEKTYAAVVAIYQQQLKTATSQSKFGAGYVLDEYILRMINEGIVKLSIQEKEVLKDYTTRVMEEDLAAYAKITQAESVKYTAHGADQRAGETSLHNPNTLPSGVSVANFKIWTQTPYFQNKFKSYMANGATKYEADRRALYQVYILKVAYYYTIQRAGEENDRVRKAAREAAIQQITNQTK